MGVNPKPDFSGWATKAGLKCTDGRTIMPNAFQHQDKVQVPLLWSHSRSGPENVLGHAVLEHRAEGVYCYGYFNETKAGQAAKALVKHKDVNKLSIYANALVEKAKAVVHGMIREVSLVIAGANPGAEIDVVHGLYIENVSVQHSDGEVVELPDEAIIHTSSEIEFRDPEPDDEADSDGAVEHAAGTTSTDSGPTVEQVYNSMTDEQKTVVHYMIGAALAQDEVDDASADNPDPNDPAAHSDEGKGDNKEEGTGEMTRNVFEGQNGNGGAGTEQKTLSHEDTQAIFAAARKVGSLRTAMEDFALAHGIDNVGTLFPNFQNTSAEPDFIKRRTEWVASVLAGVGHTPFSRIRTILADITMDDARAKGYVKGNLKTEEFFSVTKRTTAPTTIYKKQKLDRDDILDITDFNVVTWLQGEMRLMIEEEIARAILIGDGRQASDPDKIKDPVAAQDGTGIRSIYKDHEMYVSTVYVNLGDALPSAAPGNGYQEVIDQMLLARGLYKGTGSPTFYTTLAVLTQMLILKDSLGRRLYQNKQDLAAALMVADIVPVEAMEPEQNANGLIGILVNLVDYNIGTDKGGELNLFDFFDIDYNQHKYLIETRASGALVKYRSAQVVMQTASGNVVVDPVTAPTYVSSTGVVTVPTQTGVTYNTVDPTTGQVGSALSAGAQAPLAAGGGTITIQAVPAAGKFFNRTWVWTFTRA